VPPEGLGNLPTIFDRLQKAHVSWKFYVQNYDPRLNYRTFDSGRFPGNRASQVIWVPILNFARYIDNPAIMRHVVPLRRYFKDLDNRTLPEVSYIVPSGPSEHPPSNLASGQAFVRGLINSLMDSKEMWRSSAFLLAYDDWGGWYDHVKPPQLPLQIGKGYGYGFRVPAILVSPYARHGYIDSTTLDFTSILRFIEDNWGLAPLTRRDATAKSIASGFDFKAAPRKASFVSAHRGPAEEEARVVRSRVYLLYLGALGLPVLIVVSAVVARMRRRRSGEVLS
jgi:phospholipase C